MTPHQEDKERAAICEISLVRQACLHISADSISEWINAGENHESRKAGGCGITDLMWMNNSSGER
jgi:hypothetical protein